MAQIILRVHDEFKDNLKIKARNRGQTLTGLIKQIIWDWMKDND